MDNVMPPGSDPPKDLVSDFDDSGRPSFQGIYRVIFWLEYAYLVRYSLAPALLLSLLLPILFFLIPSIFVGLFDARGMWSLMFIAWIALSLAWTIMVTGRLVLVYAPNRYPDLPRIPLKEVSVRVALYFALLAVPLLALTWYGSQGISRSGKAIAVVLGSLFAVAMLFFTAWIHFSIEPEGGTTASKVLPSFGFLRSKAKPHIATKSGPIFSGPLFAGIWQGGRFRSGHQLASTLLGMLLVAYVAMGFIYSPRKINGEFEPAALFYAIFLITLLTWMLSGFAFFLDRFRIPVLATLLAVSFLTGAIRTDDKFEVTHAPRGPIVAGLSPPEVIKTWNTHRGGDGKPITIVATAGGGIQAAAWTATVLAGLQQSCSEKFSSSLVLVSSVSGGSAGAMYFLAEYDGNTGIFTGDRDTIAKIPRYASRSSLSAVGWGFLYPDLLRTLPAFGVFEPETVDRGWALEKAWTHGWGAGAPVLSSWREDVSNGMRPAVIFNATASETGQRFVISTTDIQYPATDKGTVQFSEAFKDWDMPVSTAARLSSAFPYVSPLARASAGDDQNTQVTRLHIADGGYYDNSGILSAVEWLKYAGDALSGHPVIFITIDESPSNLGKGQRWSWQRQLIGPLETLIHSRSSTQASRDALESKLAEKAFSRVTSISPVAFNYASDMPTPLSWHLTPEQSTAITRYWDTSSDVDSSKKMVGSLLNCTVK